MASDSICATAEKALEDGHRIQETVIGVDEQSVSQSVSQSVKRCIRFYLLSAAHNLRLYRQRMCSLTSMSRSPPGP